MPESPADTSRSVTVVASDWSHAASLAGTLFGLLLIGALWLIGSRIGLVDNWFRFVDLAFARIQAITADRLAGIAFGIALAGCLGAVCLDGRGKRFPLWELLIVGASGLAALLWLPALAIGWPSSGIAGGLAEIIPPGLRNIVVPVALGTTGVALGLGTRARRRIVSAGSLAAAGSLAGLILVTLVESARGPSAVSVEEATLLRLLAEGAWLALPLGLVVSPLGLAMADRRGWSLALTILALALAWLVGVQKGSEVPAELTEWTGAAWYIGALLLGNLVFLITVQLANGAALGGDPPCWWSKRSRTVAMAIAASVLLGWPAGAIAGELWGADLLADLADSPTMTRSVHLGVGLATMLLGGIPFVLVYRGQVAGELASRPEGIHRG